MGSFFFNYFFFYYFLNGELQTDGRDSIDWTFRSMLASESKR